MKQLASRYPLLFCVALIVVYELIVSVIRVFLRATTLPQMTAAAACQAVIAIYVIILLSLFAWWREAGFRSAEHPGRMLAYLPWLILPLLQVLGAEAPPATAGLVIMTGIFTLLVGFTEEGLVRGLMIRTLLPGGAMRAAVLSSVIFGAGHFANALYGHDIRATAVQCLTAAFIGLGFAGCRLYSGTIVPAVVLHALIDFSDFGSRGFKPPSTEASMSIRNAIPAFIITGLYALYGWWLVRRFQKSTCPRPAEATEGGTGRR